MRRDERNMEAAGKEAEDEPHVRAMAEGFAQRFPERLRLLDRARSHVHRRRSDHEGEWQHPEPDCEQHQRQVPQVDPIRGEPDERERPRVDPCGGRTASDHYGREQCGEARAGRQVLKRARYRGR